MARFVGIMYDAAASCKLHYTSVLLTSNSEGGLVTVRGKDVDPHSHSHSKQVATMTNNLAFRTAFSFLMMRFFILSSSVPPSGDDPGII
jgi:hypothetical protein